VKLLVAVNSIHCATTGTYIYALEIKRKQVKVPTVPQQSIL